MALEDVIRQYKEGKITKEELDRKVKEALEAPEGMLEQRQVSLEEDVNFTEARELLKSMRERSRKIKEL